MPYRYTTNRNFEDYASGRIFYAQSGQPAFPVRLTSEIFQRALALWRAAGGEGRVHIYDPVCGGAYWLTVLTFLHWEAIASITASDVDGEALSQTERNLALLTLAGLDRRIAEIEALLLEFGKASHAMALKSARQFRQQLQVNQMSHSIPTQVFQANALDFAQIQRGLGSQQVDLVLADVPYGQHATWVADEEQNQPPAAQMLHALHPLLKPGVVVAIASDKAQKIHPQNYRRLERFQIGKRRILLLQPL